MVKLTERERIEILCMIGFGDRMRTQKEVVQVELFNETHPDRHPIIQSMVSNIESKYRNFGHVRDLPKSGRHSKSEEDQLNVLLAIQENRHSTLNQLASDFNMAAFHSSQNYEKKAMYHPYKAHHWFKVNAGYINANQRPVLLLLCRFGIPFVPFDFFLKALKYFVAVPFILPPLNTSSPKMFNSPLAVKHPSTLIVTGGGSWVFYMGGHRDTHITT
ncbi:hypothetical protein NQ318_020533 [Aromia moschata]|uniref:Uncharacterized protein n=1 Tax=Aromia moschata TaxID=1265417 RepID=A0AAV8Z1I9_9CUCU|nr:hypothetical protein NQ318_020533 [Aromia moschata]